MRGVPAYRIEALAGRNQLVFPVHRRDDPLACLNPVKGVLAGDVRHGQSGQNGTGRRRDAKVHRRASSTCNESSFLDQVHRSDSAKRFLPSLATVSRESPAEALNESHLMVLFQDGKNAAVM